MESQGSKSKRTGKFRMSSYFFFASLKEKLLGFITSSFFFDFLTFVFTGLSVGFILTISESQSVLDYLGMGKNTFIYIAFLSLLIIAAILFYVKQEKSSKTQEAFKKINEVMNASFQIIFSFFIQKMMLIKESTSKEKIKHYLGHFNEVELFRNLVESLSAFLKNLLTEKLETKIDIFKCVNGELSPIIDTFINGTFASNQKSHSFEIPLQVSKEKAHFDSLAAFSFCRNVIGYIRNIEQIKVKLDQLTDEKYKLKIIDKRNLFFKNHEATEGFFLGTLLCFPLTYNGQKFGILSIGFKKNDIEHDLKQQGITIDDFKKSISTFIEKYTKFVLFTSQGIENLVAHYS